MEDDGDDGDAECEMATDGLSLCRKPLSGAAMTSVQYRRPILRVAADERRRPCPMRRRGQRADQSSSAPDAGGCAKGQAKACLLPRADREADRRTRGFMPGPVYYVSE